MPVMEQILNRCMEKNQNNFNFFSTISLHYLSVSVFLCQRSAQHSISLFLNHVAAIPEVEEVLKTWNIEQTDVLLNKVEEVKQNRIKNEREQEEKECNR